MWVNHLKSWQNCVYQSILSLVLTFPVYADIVTDGTVGSAQALTGPNFTIPENLGSRAGANLFHSFQRFNIFQGELATFTGSNSIANVISRVTGGQASTINGLLRSTVGQADFYFINPAGVMFGANAQIDVPSSFYVSTANELRFPDGTVYSATNPAASTLSIDQPQSFGFLGDQTAKIDVVGSTLVLNPSKTFSLSGGELAIDGSRLLIETGEIQLVATGDETITTTVKGNLSGPAQGNLRINNSLINVSGDGPGTLQLRAGQSKINSSSLFADNTGVTDAGLGKGIDIRAASLGMVSSLITTNTSGQNAANIFVDVENQLSVANGGAIGSNTLTAGDSGKVSVNAGQLVIDGQGLLTGIFSSALSGATGNAGTVDVSVKDQLSVFNGGQIYSNTFANGDAGEVSVNTGQLVIDGQGGNVATGIASQSRSTGSSGTINVMVKNQMSLLNGGLIDNSTFSFGNAGKIGLSVEDQISILNGGLISNSTFANGNAGELTMNVGKMIINKQGSNLRTGITSQSHSIGNAGKIDLTVKDGLSITNGGQISSIAFARGDAGDVIVNTDQLVIDRQASLSATGIASQTQSSGNAGTVSLIVNDQLSLLNGGTIDSSTFSAGDADKVTVNAGQLVIDRNGSNFKTGITSDANLNSTGNAGILEVMVKDQLSIVDGGTISSSTFATGEAGEVSVDAGQLVIDREGSIFETEITSDAKIGSSGNAGRLDLIVKDKLSIVNGGTISSSTFSTGDAGKVSVSAGQLEVDGHRLVTGISSSALPGSTGNAGNIEVTVNDQVSILNGGQISSTTFADGDAGEVTVNAGQVTINRQGSLLETGIVSQTQTSGNAGAVSVIVKDQLSIVNGGTIDSSTFAAGDAGKLTVNAGQLEVNGQGLVASISSIASSGSTGNAGNIGVTVKDQLSILNGGQISSNTFADGAAGEVIVNAGQLAIDGQGSVSGTGIASQTQSRGDAGTVSVMVEDQLSLMNRGTIDSSTFATGDAGVVSVKAQQLMIDGQNQVTGIFSSTRSTGKAGKVGVAATDRLTIVNGGTINTNTSAGGDAGEVTVNAQQLLIDRQGSHFGTGIGSQTFSSGNAGTVSVLVNDQLSLLNGGTIDSSTFATGDAGKLNVSVKDRLSMKNGGKISSSTLAEGNAGEVIVNARQLEIDGQGLATGIFSGTAPESTGNAGKIGVRVMDRLTIFNGGTINSNTLADGNAGEVTVNARQLLIDRQGSRFGTGIGSQTLSSGNAGIVNMMITDQLSLINGGTIDNSTFAEGNAGKMQLEAGEIFIDAKNSEFLTGIANVATIDSSGQAGNVTIDTQNLSIINGGRITIESLPTIDTASLTAIQPTQINITAKNITLTNSSITTESSGNVPAGSITLNVGDTLSLDPSSISTAANNADGGAISIRAKVIDLQDSQITTSVSGQGDGGNINLDTDVLVLDSGFIQANTSGVNAKGGDIRIDTNALVANNNNLLTGGDTPLSFQPGLNVIQAAAPDGVSGNIDITSPQLDISGDLIDLDATLLNVDDLAQNPCATTGGKQSTLVSLGRGGLPESPEQAGSIIITPERLQWLLPRPDTITDPESGSLHPETTRPKESTIESKTWLAWLEPDC